MTLTITCVKWLYNRCTVIKSIDEQNQKLLCWTFFVQTIYFHVYRYELHSLLVWNQLCNSVYYILDYYMHIKGVCVVYCYLFITWTTNASSSRRPLNPHNITNIDSILVCRWLFAGNQEIDCAKNSLSFLFYVVIPCIIDGQTKRLFHIMYITHEHFPVYITKKSYAFHEYIIEFYPGTSGIKITFVCLICCHPVIRRHCVLQSLVFKVND